MRMCACVSVTEKILPYFEASLIKLGSNAQFEFISPCTHKKFSQLVSAVCARAYIQGNSWKTVSLTSISGQSPGGEGGRDVAE